MVKCWFVCKCSLQKNGDSFGRKNDDSLKKKIGVVLDEDHDHFENHL